MQVEQRLQLADRLLALAQLAEQQQAVLVGERGEHGRRRAGAGTHLRHVERGSHAHQGSNAINQCLTIYLFTLYLSIYCFRLPSGIASSAPSAIFVGVTRQPKPAPCSHQPIPPLPRYLALAYAALVIYASLHPFAGWRDLGVPAFAFLDAGWPRYWTAFDLAINVVAYVPLGYLLALALSRHAGRLLPALLGALIAAGISFGRGRSDLAADARRVKSRSCLQHARRPAPAPLPPGAAGRAHSSGWPVPSAAWSPLIPHADAGLVLFRPLAADATVAGDRTVRRRRPSTAARPVAGDRLRRPSFFALELTIIACNTVASASSHAPCSPAAIPPMRWCSPSCSLR